jgi:hypothetical protein
MLQDFEINSFHGQIALLTCVCFFVSIHTSVYSKTRIPSPSKQKTDAIFSESTVKEDVKILKEYLKKPETRRKAKSLGISNDQYNYATKNLEKKLSDEKIMKFATVLVTKKGTDLSKGSSSVSKQEEMEKKKTPMYEGTAEFGKGVGELIIVLIFAAILSPIVIPYAIISITYCTITGESCTIM